MPKTRLQKEEIRTEIADRLTKSAGVVLVNMQGVKVSEMEGIRDKLFEDGMHLQVAKNSLLRLVLAEQKIEIPAELLDQPLALVYSYTDPVAAAKQIAPFAKEIEALEIVGGIMDGQFMSVSSVQA